MAAGDGRHLEIPRGMRRFMSKTRAAHSASAAAAIGVLKRLGLDPERATRPRHETPAKQRRRRGGE